MLVFVSCLRIFSSYLKITSLLHFKSAPMSKLVGFLPDNIPRILINRDIVQVVKSPVKPDEFCLFDACLLGNCDAVTQAIKDKISNTDVDTNTEEENNSGGLVNDENYGTWLKNQPRESILLFEGALLSAPIAKDAAIPLPNVFVFCDHCRNEIKGNIFCCKNCFDFDLCCDCYPKVKLTHADGKHEFGMEST